MAADKLAYGASLHSVFMSFANAWFYCQQLSSTTVEHLI